MMNSDLCVNLNVGGSLFSTSLASLRKFPNSMLGAMFSGNHTTPQTSNGTYFIDRDGTHFRHILNFLRDPESGIVELPPRDEEELKREAKYYALHDEMFGPEPTDEVVTITEDGEDGDSATFTLAADDVWYQSNRAHGDAPEEAVIVKVCQVCKSGFYHDASNLCTRYIKGFANKTGRVNHKQPLMENRECTVCYGEKLVDLDAIHNGGVIGFRSVGFKHFGGSFHMEFARVNSTTDGESWLIEYMWMPSDEQDLGILTSTFRSGIFDYASYITKDQIMLTGLILEPVLVKPETTMIVEDATVVPNNNTDVQPEPVYEIRLNKKSIDKMKRTDLYIRFQQIQI